MVKLNVEGGCILDKVIFFDGECHFCHRSVQFIIKRDPEGKFKFCSQQSGLGKEMMNKYNMPKDINSLLLLEEHKWYDKSSAALRICKLLKAPWSFLSLLLLIPKKVRDFFYDFISNNRYKLVGNKQKCKLPTENIRNRFL